MRSYPPSSPAAVRAAVATALWAPPYDLEAAGAGAGAETEAEAGAEAKEAEGTPPQHSGRGGGGTVAEEMAATRVQAAYRGYRARRPCSSLVEEPAAAQVFWTMERVRRRRAAAGRPAALREMSARQLLEEKGEIKLLLVGLDRQFEAKHGRMPSKTEKERLRPIYRLYNDLKRLLAAAGVGAEQGGGATPAKKSSSAAASAAAVAAARAGGGGSAAATPLAAAAAPRRQQHARRQSAGPASAGEAAPSELESLRREKRRLQVQLNRFEQMFQRANGRPIKWESDISAVKADYERYKVLKARISAVVARNDEGSARQQTHGRGLAGRVAPNVH